MFLSARSIARRPAPGEDGQALGRLGATLQVRGTSIRKTAVAIVCQVWQRGGPLSDLPPVAPAVLRYPCGQRH